MRRYLLAAVSVLVVSNSLAAQESLWSGTMTAGKDEINGNRVVGYNRSPAAPVMGELSDAEFDFRGITYRVYSLLQAENNGSPQTGVGRLRRDRRVGEGCWQRGRPRN